MTVYVIVQLKMTDRAAYDRYQARFFDVFRKFKGRLLSADENPAVLEGSWNRDKLVLMSFPDEAAFRSWSELDRNIWKSPKTAKLARKGSCCWRRDLRRRDPRPITNMDMDPSRIRGTGRMVRSSRNREGRNNNDKADNN